MNKRYVVVSSNNNSDYFYYAKYLEKAWNSYGWDLCVMITHDVDPKDLELNNPNSIIIQLPKIEGLRDATIAQAGRLYAANYLPLDALIMTSDMDLLPLSNYWNPNINDITVFGHDLTWYSFYPMGYIAMSGAKWKEKMNLSFNTEKDMLKDAHDSTIKYSPFSEDWETWWNYDWSLVTARLKPFESEITFVNRGQVKVANNTLALGRVDRFNWDATLEHCEKTEFIDCHAENNNVEHPDKLNKFLTVFGKFHGKL